MTETKISKTASATELALIAKSREAFDKYGALDGDPQEAGLNELQCLQVDLCRWEVKNFGVQTADRSCWGIVEEIGEMLDAIGTQDGESEVEDAIGDTLVFTVNLCTKMRIDFDSIMDIAKNSLQQYSGLDALTLIYRNLGKLAHISLKTLQQVRGYEDKDVQRRDTCIIVSRLVICLNSLAQMNGMSAEGLLIDTALKVMDRDWVKYPKTGLPDGNESVPETATRH